MATFGPWLGVPPGMQRVCAVEGCQVEGKPHPCPFDGGYHHHGCVHYEDVKIEGITFRVGWGLLCDEHFRAVANWHPPQRAITENKESK